MKIDRRRITIKLSTDYDRIQNLDKICFPLDEPVDLFKVSHVCWLAYYHHYIIGYSTIYEEKPGTIFIDRMGVIPKFRRNGCQHKLMGAIIRWAIRNENNQVVSYTSTDNSPSSNTFISCGFKTFVPSLVSETNFVSWQLILKGD